MAASNVSLSVLRSSNNLLSRFEGCLLGALLGDCLGAKFEYNSKATQDDIVQYFSGFKKKNTGEQEIVCYEIANITCTCNVNYLLNV